MTELLTSLVGPAMEDLGKTILARVKRQFIYLCCFNSNIQNLRDEAEKLKNERDGLQMRVDTANRNIQVVLPVVEAWLEESKKFQVEGSGIEDEIKNVKSGCFAIKSHFSLSKKAKKAAEAMKDHRENCKFDEISVPALPPSMAPIPRGPSHEFESRKQIEEEIMKDLRDGKVHMMGICGMGGVGKTTMAKKIMNRVREENVFQEVVMVVISQEVRLLEIQREIAENLDLKLDEESLSVRACKLRARLMGAKSILLILDDVWEGLNLEDLGIPCKRDIGEGCTIMLTSRNRDVLSKMDAKPYAMAILSGNEAWSLFREKVGTWLDDSELLSIAKEVEKECKRLPIALVIVGTTLKNETNKHIWEDALHQLKSSNPTAMSDVLRDVYKPLKLSYDFLDNPDARSLFLLCCLFPEDHDIPLEYLTMYGMGLRMFDGIMSLEEARNRIHTLLKMLKGRFLLLDGRDENHVKMHDVVRDVAIFIASEEGRVDHNLSLADSSKEESIDCTWISVSVEEINKLSIGLSFPSLHLLLINKFSTEPSLPCSFFKGKEELNVLFFGSISFRSLPETTQLLKKLRTLHLYNCYWLETISIVGELLSLEILICRSCGEIAELPVEIGRLKRLKLLEVSQCYRLKRIAPGVISNLVQLVEFMIVESFNGWERKKGNGEQRENATLCELEHLKYLTRLEIEIEDITLAEEEICLPSKIVKYDIKLAAKTLKFKIGEVYERSMYLGAYSDITFGECFYMFIRSTEFLYAGGDYANNLDIAQAQKMKRLLYVDCSMVNTLVNITTSMDSSVGVFPHLESLELNNLDNLEEICDGPIPKLSNSFGNLKKLRLECLPALRHIWKSPHQNVSLCNLSSIWLSKCHKLQKLFPLSIAKNGLLQLETIEIGLCRMMEEVFSNEESEKDGEQCDRITFPKLKSLKLQYLPSMITFCEGSESIDFPQLQKISMEFCSKLKSLISCTRNSLNLGGRDDSFHVFCNQKVNTLVNITTSMDSSVGVFPHLEYLELQFLDNLEEICDGPIPKLSNSFGNLKKLALRGLPALRHIWKSPHQNISLCNLSSIKLWKCDKLEKLFPLSIAKDGLLQLETIEVLSCWMMEEVFSNEENEKNGEQCDRITFPKLKSLTLQYLPSLTTFCKGSENIDFPLLEEISIKECRKLTSLISCTLNNLNLEGRGDSFHVFCNQKVNTLVNITTSMDSSIGVFHHLESLRLYALDNLEEICDGPITKLSNSFGNLKELSLEWLPALRHIWKSPHQNISLCNLSSIYLCHCGKLQKLFPLSIATNGLLQLETLEIETCEMMEEVFSNEENVKDGEQCDRITFPKLKILKLQSLPSMITFCKGSENIDFPLLEKISIKECGKLTSLISCTQNSLNLGGRDDSFHAFCNQKVIFGNLEKFYIEDCNGIRSLFSYSVAENLDNLQTLSIQRCNEMVKVIEYDEEILTKKSLFPRMKYMIINSLPKLESFCKWRHNLQLSSSKIVHITDCPLLEPFTKESESTSAEAKRVGAHNEIIEIEEEKD